jgi:hypothetical protein
MKTVLLWLALTSSPTFTTHLDRTAVWVGDQFHYLIIVEYPSDYEFVLDNLTRETVNMDPFQVIDVGKNVIAQKDSTRKLFVDLTLANFSIGQSSVQIPQLTLFYFRRGSRTAGFDQADAESLPIPGPSIGIRSTLPSQPEDIRDAIALNSWDRNRSLIPAVALICGAVLIVGLGREVVLYRKRMKARQGPDLQKAMDAVRARWLSGIPSEFTDAKTCSAFYEQSYHSLKEYMGYYLDTPILGLTGDELRGEMQRLGAKADMAERVIKVLESCERLRYAPDGYPAEPEAARGIAQDMREILSAGK